MKVIYLIALSALFLLLPACKEGGKNKSTATNSSNWEQFDTEEFSIQYPKTWRLDTSGYRGTVFAIFTKQTSLLDKFIENVSLNIQDYDTATVDFDSYMAEKEEELKKTSIDNKLLFSERQLTDGKEFHKVLYKVKQGMHIIKFEQYYLPVAHKVYLLTLACTENQFKNYHDKGLKIMNSFKIKQ